MAVRLTCSDNASGHDGLRWRMGPDAQSVDIVVGETAPGAGELIVSDPITPEACFTVAAYSGTDEGAKASVCSETDKEDLSGAQIGDEIGGGIYAGVHTIGGVDYYVISAKASGEVVDLMWKTSKTRTAGTDSDDDGLANTQSMEAAGLAEHPSADHCVSYGGGGYNDWYMPARNELTLIYNSLSGHPEFADNVAASSDSTRSSTQHPTIDRIAWARRFSDNGETAPDKDDATRVRLRPVRRVAV